VRQNQVQNDWLDEMGQRSDKQAGRVPGTG